MKRMLLLLCILSIALLACEKNPDPLTVPYTDAGDILVGGHPVSVEIADTPQEQSKGLMNRDSLHENNGMLFIFDPPRKAHFWMKNVSFPLDLLFINQYGTITYIEEDVPPCTVDECPTYGPGYPVSYVLEVNGGYVEEKGVLEGEKISVK